MLDCSSEILFWYLIYCVKYAHKNSKAKPHKSPTKTVEKEYKFSNDGLTIVEIILSSGTRSVSVVVFSAGVNSVGRLLLGFVEFNITYLTLNLYNAKINKNPTINEYTNKRWRFFNLFLINLLIFFNHTFFC